MHGGAKTRFWYFEGSEQSNSTRFSAALGLLVSLDLVPDGCGENLVRKLLHNVIVALLPGEWVTEA